ncbi:MAG TPA: hypothetical protein VF275_05300 [Gammaproteobacteria bacterium]
MTPRSPQANFSSPRLWAGLLLAVLSPVALGAAEPATGPETFLESLESMEETGMLPGFRFRTGVFASDNITRSQDEELDELAAVAEIGGNWHSVGTRFAAAFDGTIAHRHYTRNDFDDEGRANFLAVGDLFIVPETLDWYITDRLANAPIDPLATTSPINVQFINVLETGPRLTLRPGSNELTIAVSRADIHAEESPIDHTRDTGAFSFMHNISGHSSFGILADVRQVEFDPEANATDFEQEEAHLSFESNSNTVDFSLAAGRSRFTLTEDLTREETTGWLRVRAQRTSDSFIYAALERTASDTATAMLRDDQLLEQGGVPTFVVTGDPFFSDRAVVRYTRGWRAHEWFVALNATDLDYFVSPLDREHRGLRLGARLLLSTRLLLSLTAAGTDIEYLDLARTDTVRSLQTEADFRINRNWSLVSGVSYLTRESDDAAYGFDETILSLFISYSPQRSEW